MWIYIKKCLFYDHSRHILSNTQINIKRSSSIFFQSKLLIHSIQFIPLNEIFIFFNWLIYSWYWNVWFNIIIIWIDGFLIVFLFLLKSFIFCKCSINLPFFFNFNIITSWSNSYHRCLCWNVIFSYFWIWNYNRTCFLFHKIIIWN